MRKYLILLNGLLLGIMLSMSNPVLGQVTSTDGFSYVQDMKDARIYNASNINSEIQAARTPDITSQTSNNEMQGVYFLIRSQRQDIEILKAMVLRQEDTIAELQKALQKVLKKNSN